MEILSQEIQHRRGDNHGGQEPHQVLEEARPRERGEKEGEGEKRGAGQCGEKRIKVLS